MITTRRDSVKSRISRERLSLWLVGMLGAIRTTSFYLTHFKEELCLVTLGAKLGQNVIK
jgi:hypothetical protein